jgi:hypothetical protein
VVAENISMISPKASVAVGDSVFFMDTDGFYLYQGSVQRLDCDVLQYVFDSLDKTQAYKVFATENQDDSEVTWFYQSEEDGAVDIDRYVTYNYKQQIWTIGTFDRGAWIHAATKQNPLATTNDTVNVETQYIYSQEKGYTADGGDIGAFIESGDIGIGDGHQFIFLRRVIPDFRVAGSGADFTMTFKGRDRPQDDWVTQDTAEIVDGTDSWSQEFIRVRSREVALRIAANNNGYGWTLGNLRFDIRTGGRK